MPEITYENFDLRIERRRNGNEYLASVLYSPGGEAENGFDAPFSKQELTTFLTLVNHPERSIGASNSPELEAVKNFGTRLFSAVFDKSVYTCFSNSLATSPRLRIRLRLKDVPELACLPWEYLYDPNDGSFLSHSSNTPIVRYMDMLKPIRALGVKPPLRILVMISSPTEEQRLDAAQEYEKLKDSVGSLERRGAVVLERLEKATLADLQTRLTKQDIHIFHFIGHGQYDEEVKEGFLIMEDEGGRGFPVSGELLATQLREHHPLRLAILNACEGARTSLTDAFGGTAQSLVGQRIPAVVAMQFKITDRAAITFASKFYQMIADYYPVDAALAQARLAIRSEGNHLEWGTPALYMRSSDGHIFARESATMRRPTLPPTTFPDTADPTEAHYRMLIKSITDGRVVPFLGADVNLCDRPEGVAYRVGEFLPSSVELAEYLAESLGLSPGNAQDLVRVSQYADLLAGPEPLYEKLHSIYAADYPATSLHRLLAALPGRLREKGHASPYQLIVTTNYDDLLERAFRDAEEPFDLVCYNAKGEERVKFWHRSPDGEVKLIKKPAGYQSLSLTQRTIILKLHGAVDRSNSERDSFVITEDNYINYLTNGDLTNLVPAVLAEKLRKSHVLFLGYRPLRDWNLRVIFHRIWGGQKLARNSWAVQLDPGAGSSDLVDRKFWGNRNVEILETRLCDYVDELDKWLQALPRAGGS